MTIPDETLRKVIEELKKVEKLETRQRAFAHLLKDYTARKQMQTKPNTATIMKKLKKYIKEEETAAQ